MELCSLRADSFTSCKHALPLTLIKIKTGNIARRIFNNQNMCHFTHLYILRFDKVNSQSKRFESCSVEASVNAVSFWYLFPQT